MLLSIEGAPGMAGNDADKMTPAQCREARGLLGLTQEELADMANLSEATVANFEAGNPVADCLTDALQVTFLAAGIDFILDSDGRGGVTLRVVQTSR
jgi:transcriptional regulator with XRE-family HTH domain